MSTLAVETALCYAELDGNDDIWLQFYSSPNICLEIHNRSINDGGIFFVLFEYICEILNIFIGLFK